MSATTDTASLESFPPPPSDPRRIVTGYDENGQVVISSDEKLKFQNKWGGPFNGCTIWSTEEVPTKDNVSMVDGGARSLPGVGLVLPQGVHHSYTELAPGQRTPMHRTASVDYNILVSGQLILVLDGIETEIKPGDVVIQRGTIHAWHNPSETEWARWVSVLIDATPVVVNGEEMGTFVRPV